MSNSLRSAAESGDINAIATLVGEAIKLTVEPKMQHGLILWLKVKSNDPKICPKMIQVIENVQPKIESIQVSGTSWNKFFILKEGKYVENTDTDTVTTSSLILVLLIGLIIAVVNILHKLPAPVTSAVPISPQGTVLGVSSTGHPLYLDPSPQP